MQTITINIVNIIRAVTALKLIHGATLNHKLKIATFDVTEAEQEQLSSAGITWHTTNKES